MPRPIRIAPLLLAVFFAACGGASDRAASKEEMVDYAEVDQGGTAAAPAPATAPAEGTATGTDLGLTRSQGNADGDATGAEQPPSAQLPSTAQADSASPTPAAADPAPARMIIYTGDATLEVEKLEPAIARVEQMAQQLGGYVANTSMQTGRENARGAMLTLKIPVARWDQALAALRPLGKVESLTTSTEDVGEEYVDVTARMNNARRLEQRLVELLASRTGRLEDVLAVERELARVREQIERYEGRLRFLRSRVANSTLTVRLHEPVSVIGGRPGDNPIVDAFRRAWDNFVGFVAGLIAMAGWLIPLLALAAAAFWLFRRFMRWPPRSDDRPGLGMSRGGTPGPHAAPPPAGDSADPDAGSAAPSSGPTQP